MNFGMAATGFSMPWCAALESENRVIPALGGGGSAEQVPVMVEKGL